MRFRTAFAVLALALLPACAVSSRPAAAATSGATLVVASDLENPPFAYLDENGEPAGRDVEMMRWIAAMLDRRLEWRRMPFDELLGACEAGEVDAVCATLGITDERLRRVDFSQPYYETVIAVVARRGDGEPRALADLVGRRVSGSVGTTSEKAVRERLRFSHGIFETGKSPDTALAGGDVDAAVMDGPAARQLVEASSGALVVVDGNLGPERYALALPKGSELLVAVDRALRVLAERGDLTVLDRRYGL